MFRRSNTSILSTIPKKLKLFNILQFRSKNLSNHSPKTSKIPNSPGNLLNTFDLRAITPNKFQNPNTLKLSSVSPETSFKSLKNSKAPSQPSKIFFPPFELFDVAILSPRTTPWAREITNSPTNPRSTRLQFFCTLSPRGPGGMQTRGGGVSRGGASAPVIFQIATHSFSHPDLLPRGRKRRSPPRLTLLSSGSPCPPPSGRTTLRFRRHKGWQPATNEKRSYLRVLQKGVEQS